MDTSDEEDFSQILLVETRTKRFKEAKVGMS